MTDITTQTPVLRQIAPHFQRSINVTYDSGNADYIGGYIPTERGAKALANALKQTNESATSRAHVFHAPYGSGKSLLSLVLSALVAKDTASQDSMVLVLDRLHRHYHDEAKIVQDFIDSGKRLLPVVLSGDEGSFTIALTRALHRSLGQLGLSDLRPKTQFEAAINTIKQWETKYPDAFQKLQTLLEPHQHTIDDLLSALTETDFPTLDLFIKLYPEVTAGAIFNPYFGVSLADVFSATAVTLRQETTHWDGIFIIWDEFGRFMEAKAGDAFGDEAPLLQDFAEFCSRSGENQVHLVLVTHRQLSTYASDLPTSYQQEWARIAERFWPHDVTSDPGVVYRLIAEAFTSPNPTLWQNFLHTHEENFKTQTKYALDTGLFPHVEDDKALRQDVINRTWPLHPLTVYALPRLSSQVAQNERTLFTFLASDEPNSLQKELISRQTEELDWWTIDIDKAWDYFAHGIRMDTRSGGTHATWSGVMFALSKISQENLIHQRLIKAMGVLTIVGDVNIQQEWDMTGKVVPSTELIAWAVGFSEEVTQMYLEELKKRRVITYRAVDGFWTFVRGSDVDLEKEIKELIDNQQPSPLQLRSLLEDSVTMPFHLPRGHNLWHNTIRYFPCTLRWADEVTRNLGSHEVLKQVGNKHGGYADGMVVYVLAKNGVEREQALNSIHELDEGRAVYVMTERPLLINEPLNDLYALRILQQNPAFLERDKERLPREIEFFVEDAERRLNKALQPLMGFNDVKWIYHHNGSWQTQVLNSNRQVSRLLTQLCNTWFSGTPKLNNESLNLHKPSSIQMNASAKVIDYLFKRQENDVFPFDLGLSGYGPDRLILRTMLVQTGLLQPIQTETDENSEPTQWQLVRPEDEALACIWDRVNTFLDNAQNNSQPITPLLEELQLPPYGLRKGVLPILLAAMMRSRLQVMTLRQKRRAVSPITGETFVELCQKPDDFTVEVGIWDTPRKLLWQVLEAQIYPFLMTQEHELQPLSYLSIGLLRWLQTLPRYCRDTETLSKEALQFRNLIRKAQRDPAKVLLHEMLTLLDDGSVSAEDETAYRTLLTNRLSHFMSEISAVYQVLNYELDNFVSEEFSTPTGLHFREGEDILKHWLQQFDKDVDGGLSGMRFSDSLVQRFVNVLQHEGEKGRFWEQASHAILGVNILDWNDQSVTSFKQSLLHARERLQRELLAIEEEEDTIELRVTLPDADESLYRFRPSELSTHGQHILQNFKSTMAIAGRPLSPDERRQVALAFLHYILNGDAPEDERKNRSFRG